MKKEQRREGKCSEVKKDEQKGKERIAMKINEGKREERREKRGEERRGEK